MIRIRLDPDGAVEGVANDGKTQLVVVGVVAVVAYREVIGEPDGELAPVGLAQAVHDVAAGGRIVGRGRADDRHAGLGLAALVFCLRRARVAEHDGQEDDGHGERKSGADAPRETGGACLAHARSKVQSCRFFHETLPPIFRNVIFWSAAEPWPRRAGA